MVEAVLSGASHPGVRPLQAARAPAWNEAAAQAEALAVHRAIVEGEDPTDQDVPGGAQGESTLFGADGLTFGDLLDIINPLQHIPVVSTIYRAITGDEISPGARIAGGALFGGPVGLALAAVNAAIETATGEDIGDTILAALTGDAAAPDDAATAAASEHDDFGAIATTAPARAMSVAEAGPAIVGGGAVPVSLLPARGPSPTASVMPPARRPQIAAGFANTTRLPFGGMGGLPFANNNDGDKDPVAAILQARGAVPGAGPVRGLGNATRAHPTYLAAMPKIGSRMSATLDALAAKHSPPPADAAGKDSAAPRIARTPQATPTNLVPRAMLDALDRYQRMKKAENAPG